MAFYYAGAEQIWRVSPALLLPSPNSGRNNGTLSKRGRARQQAARPESLGAEHVNKFVGCRRNRQKCEPENSDERKSKIYEQVAKELASALRRQ